jgi:exonuclease SbcD
VPGLPVLVIPGNHDSAPRVSFASGFLRNFGIHVQTQTSQMDTPLTLRDADGEWDFYAVPWLSGSSQRLLWQDALAALKARRRPGVPAVLVGHLFTAGGKESDSERIFVGEGEQLPVDVIAGWDYVALGHLHKTQQPAPGVWYSGSPLAYSFSEAGTAQLAVPKAFLRVEGPVGALVATPVAVVPLRPMSRLASTYQDFLESPVWREFESHYLELTLTDASLVSQPLDRLRLRFTNILSLSQQALPQTERTLTLAATGSLETDTLAFLEDLGPALSPEARSWVSRLVAEVFHETP